MTVGFSRASAVEQQRFLEAAGLQNRGEITSAVKIYGALLKGTSSAELAWWCMFALGCCCHMLRSLAYDPAEATRNMIIFLENAVRAKPRHPRARLMLGLAYWFAQRPREASEQHRAALELQSGMVQAWVHLGHCSRDLGDLERARELYESVVDAPPVAVDGEAARRGEEMDAVEGRWNRAVSMLLLGRFREGWAEHEYLNRIAPTWRRRFRGPQDPDSARAWRGQELAGRLAVWAGDNGFWGGGGFGDDMLFARWVPLARERLGELTLVVRPTLVSLMRDQFDGVDVRTYDEPGTDEEAWASLLSLPYLCGSEQPPSTPYLKAQRPFRPLAGTYRVGFVWATRDPLRATALADWAPVLAVPGVTFYSLQLWGEEAKYLGAPDLGNSPPVWPVEGDIHDLAPELTDWGQTAAVLNQLDLVITIDSSVANLAGAMGRSVWICLPATEEWRWGLEIRETPWYGSARLYRQEKCGDWSGVFADVAQDLEAKLKQATSPDCGLSVRGNSAALSFTPQLPA
jgi:Tetratricopeptide repeat